LKIIKLDKNQIRNEGANYVAQVLQTKTTVKFISSYFRLHAN